MDDFCFYMKNHSYALKDHQWSAKMALVLHQIIISQYVKLIDFVRATILARQRSLSRQDKLDLDITKVEQQWSDVQQWQRRSNEYCEDVENILLALGIPLKDPDTSSLRRGTFDYATDYQFIYMRLKQHHHRVEHLNSTMTALASIAGNRQGTREHELSVKAVKQSILEAKRTKSLTSVGLVFIPLAYTASLFSMDNSYTPGAKKFWVYWVVSIPLIIVVISGYYLLDQGFNDEGMWSLDHFFYALQSRLGSFSKKKDYGRGTSDAMLRPRDANGSV
jgi:hypothetical protein